VTYEYDCQVLPFAEAVREAAAFGARNCACADEACKKAVFDELDRWRNDRSQIYQDPTPDERARYLKAVEPFSKCPAGP
jgi:hypothetical protein